MKLSNIKTIYILSTFIMILILINVFLLSKLNNPNSFLAKKNAGPGLKNNIEAIFDFDEKELKIFDLSKETHYNKIRELNDRMRSKTIQYYLEKDRANKELLKNELIEIGLEIYTANDNHLADVKSLLNESELKDFDEFVRTLIDRSPPEDRPRPKKK